MTTKRKEVDHNLWVWGSVPRALRARGSPAMIKLQAPAIMGQLLDAKEMGFESAAQRIF